MITAAQPITFNLSEFDDWSLTYHLYAESAGLAS